MKPTRGTLKTTEPHPMAIEAYKYILSIPSDKLSLQLEALSSCSIENNRTAEICAETLNRILHNKPVSDRYLLGLAWFLKTIEEKGECNRD